MFYGSENYLIQSYADAIATILANGEDVNKL
jgi:hypothetical protein